MNIFQELNKRGVCYSVINAEVTIANAVTNQSGREHTITVDGRDFRDLRGLGFFKEKEINKNLMHRVLNEEQIQQFKECFEDFTLALRDNETYLYELKNNSFRKRFKDDK